MWRASSGPGRADAPGILLTVNSTLTRQQVAGPGQQAKPGQQVWTAQPRQRVFLSRAEDEVLYGGAAGGGKSDALIIWLITRATRHPGSNGLYLRRTYADLSRADAALDRSRELLTGIAKYDSERHRWTVPGTGSVIDFGYLEHEDDKYRYQSSQYDSIAFDELTQFSEAQYVYMLSRNRATVDGIKPQVRAATNPGGIGHQWVKLRFVDRAAPEQPFSLQLFPGQKQARTGCFVPAKLADNQVLMDRDPGYWERLMALDEDSRRALAYGDWNVFAGQFFTEWRAEKHVVVPFDIPKHWLRWASVDYGFADPCCVLWFVRDPAAKHHVFVYREMYVVGLRDEDQARRLLQLSKGEKLAMVVGDPSMFNRRSEQGKASIAAVYWRNKVNIVPGVNDRIAGWQTVRRALAHDDTHAPRLQVFNSCLNLIRTLPAMIYDPLDSEDLADKVRTVKTEDHAVDCLRYGLVLESMPEQQRAKLRDFKYVAA